MRIHSISPVLVQSPPCPTDNADPSVVDRYCQNCDIRFSNLRTYQAHKTHYCNTRHVVKPTPSSSPMPNNPSPTSVVPTYLALPTNPVIVVPYTLVQNASVLSALSADIGPSPPTDTACIVLSDGTLQPIAQALVPTKFNMGNSDNIQRDHSQSPPEEFFSPPQKAESISPETKKRPAPQPSSPLDLRLKRVSKSSQDAAGCTDGEEEKENRRSDGNVTDAEDIVCAPSIPCMILSPSSSPTSGGGGDSGGGNKTPQHRSGMQHLHHNQQLQQHHHQQQQLQQQQQQQQHHHRNHIPQPPTNGVVQHSGKLIPMYDGTDRNGGKFSVSNLLHVSGVKQEPASNNGEPPHPAMHHMPTAAPHHRFSAMHKSLLSSAVVAPMPPGVQPRGLGELLNPAAVLPYFTPDMTLRLAANSGQDGAGGMPPAHHQFYLKQGPSKCESCNIVFCKYENFLAHKKHYCASRPPPDGGDGEADKTSPEGSPGPKPLTVSSPQSSKDSVSPTPVLKPPMIQFICSTCGVKFSSFDNLTTHQTFYCPNRTAGALQESVDNKAASLALPSKCPKCKMTIDGTQHHQCQPTNCWKCPVCGAVCSSASAAQKHLDNHNGIRAFVCTICQYKGNTLRGLRTHIRMHFNKRMIPDLMEEDYVTCLIDENSASSMVDGRAKTPTTSDSADKPFVPSTVLVKTATAAAAAAAALSSPSPSPSSSLSSTAATATAVVVVDDEPKELVVVKQESVNGVAAAPPADEPATVIGNHQQPTATSDDLQAQQQLPAQSQLQLQSAVGNKRPGITAKYCKACDISFNYLSTFIAHKKYYCRNSTEYKCNTENAKTATVT